jgi:hypothetical protein
MPLEACIVVSACLERAGGQIRRRMTLGGGCGLRAIQRVLGACWEFPRVDAGLDEPAEWLWLLLSEPAAGGASLAVTVLTTSA